MEIIYYNGRIITMAENDEEDAIKRAPQAVVVKNGKIINIGDYKKLKDTVSKNAKCVDLQGNCLMPSFIDTHSHAVMNGQMTLLADLSGCTSFEEIVKTLRDYINKNKITSRNAVIGFGYDHNFLAEGKHPDKRILDRISSDIPILILHVSAHLACVNSVVLQMAGIDEKTLNPVGGVIGRLLDSNEPSGYLEETAVACVQKIVAKRMKINIFKMFQGVQNIYIQNGITTIQDGATTYSDYCLLNFLALFRRLKVDVVAYPLMSADAKKIMKHSFKRLRVYKNRFKIGGYKLVLDGSPQGRSAWMSKPYLGEDAEYCGYPWLKDEQVEAYVTQAINENQQLLAHCNGDAASEQYLKAYEKALSDKKGNKELRPVMIHCQTVRNDQLDRMSELGMIASMFIGHVWYWGDVHKKNFGEERGNHISPARDALDRGVSVNFHQDTPITKPDMLHSIWCAVNRVSRGNDVIGAEQRVSVYEALKAVTINAAYQYFEEDSKGTLEIGKRADMVILDKSPLEVDVSQLCNIIVLETIKDGKTIYSCD